MSDNPYGAFGEGYDCALAVISGEKDGGNPDDLCPHPEGTPEAVDWNFGWLAAWSDEFPEDAEGNRIEF